MVDGSGTDGAGILGDGDPMNGPNLGLSVHVLRVTLLDVSPLVWRLLRVPSAVRLSALHAVLQVAMGWEDRHLHQWRVGDDVYASADEEDWGEDLVDEATAVLGEIAGVDSVFRYDYDLGDGWSTWSRWWRSRSTTGLFHRSRCLTGRARPPRRTRAGPKGMRTSSTLWMTRPTRTTRSWLP